MKKTLLLFIQFFGAFQLFGMTYYVTPSGAGTLDGSSWSNAASGENLQAVINGAIAGDEVWVGCGIYLPTSTSDRSFSFSMRNDIGIYGSFLGSETNLSERDFSCGPCSVLSGEIGSAGIADNSYTVVSNSDLTNTAVLDGFEIRDGNDDRSPTSLGDGLGGGMYNHGFGAGGFCHPVVRNCVFTNNRASWGGGAFNNGYNGGNAQPTYISCIFSENHGYVEAGGMDSYGVGGNASPTLYNCVFDGNTSATNVGAMYCWGGNPGGNCHPVLVNCIFTNNTATNGFAGAFIANNQDENGSSSSGSCTVTLQNCIVWNNAATGAGPQFFVLGNGAQVVATYSDIDMTGQNGTHVLSGPGTGNLTSNPQFVNLSNARGVDGCWMSADDGLRVLVTSPVVDAGDNANTYASDLVGIARVQGAAVDMGAYEMQPLSQLAALSMTNALQVYPNPANDQLHVALPEVLVQLVVFNGLGEEQLRSKITDFSVANLAPGIYLLEAQGMSGAIFVARFVKE